MAVYIGVDTHARQQTVSYLDTDDGTTGQQELRHERDDIRAFRPVGGGHQHRSLAGSCFDCDQDTLEKLIGASVFMPAPHDYQIMLGINPDRI